MSDGLRSLLTEVAEGRLDPTAAARRLDDLERPSTGSSAGPSAGPAEGPATEDPWAAATDHDQTPGTPGTATRAGSGATEGPDAGPTGDAAGATVPAQAPARPVRVIGDPTVATITVDGPHTVRRDGATLRVEAPVAAGADPEGSYRYERKTGLSRWISQATLLGVPMTLRVNPDLELDA